MRHQAPRAWGLAPSPEITRARGHALRVSRSAGSRRACAASDEAVTTITILRAAVVAALSVAPQWMAGASLASAPQASDAACKPGRLVRPGPCEPCY